jgi:hypothetical protein
VGLFKRKTTLEDAVRGHLERLGVSPFWLRSALDAIRHCDAGDPFQPVFSVAGPAPARSVVALMSLEPFLRGKIDWTISPSESPLWVGSIGDLQDQAFDAASDRFLELYASPDDVGVRPELEGALRVMVKAVEETLADRAELDEESRRGLRALGAAGYVWRLAESSAPTTDLNRRADLVREVDAVVASLAGDVREDNLLGSAASECLRRNLLLASGSPGGWATGGEFLRRGFRFAESSIWPDAPLPRRERWYAFSFGVALFEVEDCFARRPEWTAGRNKRLTVVP